MPPQPNNNPAATTDYGTAYNELGAEYQPQLDSIANEQTQANQANTTALNTLKATQTSDLSSLDQAKANAFTNNALTSNARGIMYSGYTPLTNQSYTTNTYNPNVDKVNTAYTTGVNSANTDLANTNQSLQDKINQINQDRANTAESLVLNTQQTNAANAKANATAANASNPLNISQSDLTRGIQAGFNSVKGSDNHVSPENLAGAYVNWTKAGLPAAAFWKSFQGYWNPKEGDYNKQFQYFVSNPGQIKSVELL